MSRTFLLNLIFVLVVVLVGCATEDNIPNEVQEISDEESNVPSSIAESPLPEIAQEVIIAESPLPTPEPLSVPQPQSGKGSVTGSLAWAESADQTVIADAATLYLAPVLESDDGVEALVSFNEERDPRTISDEFGRFIFSDIEPGTYGLIFSIPGVGADMIEKFQDDEDFLIVVEADQIIELDQIIAEFPF